MKRIIDLILAISELLEAEGRTLRRNTIKLSHSVALLGVAYLLLVLGGLFIAWALYELLLQYVTNVEAGLIVGAAIAAIGGGLLWKIQKDNA